MNIERLLASAVSIEASDNSDGYHAIVCYPDGHCDRFFITPDCVWQTAFVGNRPIFANTYVIDIVEYATITSVINRAIQFQGVI